MLFYLPDFSQPVLSETESQHAVRVLRLGKGDVLEVTDGKGQRTTARIREANPKKCGLELLEINPVEKNWRGEIWLAVAPTKNLDRMEWLVEKGTEIGCDGFVFVRTARTERAQLNLERLEKVAVSAMKQSGQAWLPQIRWIPKWADFPWQEFDRIFLADLETKATEFSRSPSEKCLLMIGPEGDFSPEERKDLATRRVEGIRLLPQVLRTETAALFALSMAHLLGPKNG